MIKSVRFVIIIAVILISFSCDFNSIFGGNEPEYSWRPEGIPQTSSPGENLPAKTNLIIDATIPMDQIGNFYLQFQTDGWKKDRRIYKNVEDGVWNGLQYLYPESYQKSYVDHPWHNYHFLSSNVITDNDWVQARIWNGFDNHFYQQWFIINPLTIKPVYMQIGHYYKKIGQANITDSQTIEYSETYETGVDLTHLISFTRALGVEHTVSASAGWGTFSASVSQTVSDEFSKTETESYSIQESKSETFTATLQGDSRPGVTIHSVWALVEVVQFVDEQGNPWDAREHGYYFNTINQDGIFGFENLIPSKAFVYATKDFYPAK